jgi:hypothetical protein
MAIMKQLLHRLTGRITNAGTALRALPLLLFFWATMANSAFATDIFAGMDGAFETKLRSAAVLNFPLGSLDHTDTRVTLCTTLDVSNSGITDLAGIEYFTALEVLNCSDNSLTALDVSTLSNHLEKLNCSGNSLTALDVSTLSNLEELNCGGNLLTVLDVSALTNLKELDCNNNSLVTLDLSGGLTNLQEVGCSFNSLTSLDVSGLTNL